MALEPMQQTTSYADDISFSTPPQQFDLSASNGSALDLSLLDFQAQDLDLFGTNMQDTAFWGQPGSLGAFNDYPWTDFGFGLSAGDLQTSATIISISEPDLDPDVDTAPAPSFLDARSSPEPLEGQGLRFDDYIRKTFANRQHLRNQGTHEKHGPGKGSRPTSYGRLFLFAELGRKNVGARKLGPCRSLTATRS